MAQRRTARAGLHLLAAGALIAGLAFAPAGSAARSAPGTGSTTATRTGHVNPLRDGVPRSASSGKAFGVPDAVGSASGLSALRRSGATVPKQYNLPHWLPQRSRSNASATQAGTATHSATGAPASGRTGTLAGQIATGQGTPLAAPPLDGLGLRSDFGVFGLSDADDSLLYGECSVFALCEEPPDPGIAVSATNIVQSVNELMLVIDRATFGGRVIPNFDFFALDHNQVAQSDPRVVYDIGRQRWFATLISSDCGHGYLQMAVSSSDDPFGIWTVYQIVFPGRVVDFPGVGTTNDTVIVSLNAYGPDPASVDCLSPGDYQGAMLVVVDWNDLVNTAATLPVTTTGPDLNLFTWRPAISAGGDTLGRLIVAIDNGSADTSDVGYATLTGTNAGRNVTLSPVVNITRDLGVKPFATPPEPRQPGDPATIERAVDGSPTDAISASGHLWFIATAPCTPSGDDSVRDCVRLTELLTGAGPSTVVMGSETLLREKGMDLFMGGVGRAIDNTLYLVYSRSSPGDQIATWSTWRSSSDAGFHDPTLLIPAGGIYSGTRWGDYVIVAPDPAQPDAVWQANEVSNVDGSWFTWLSQIRPAPLGTLAGTVKVNGGDAYAGETFVDLQLANPKDVAVTVVRVANDPATRNGVLVGGQTLPVSTDLPWSLAIDQPEGGPPDGPRRVYVQWGDGRGNWSDVVSDSIILDTVGPTIGAVSAPRVGTSFLGSKGSIPVAITWQAGRDRLSGLEGYDVEIRSDGGDWQDFANTATASATGRVQAGHRYQWRVRSYDRLGNVSDWLEGVAVRIDAVDDKSASIRYAGAWRTAAAPAAYRGGVHATSTSGASATITFTGRAFAIAGGVAAGRGALTVFVDGHRVGSFVEGLTPARSSRIGFARSVTPGRHTVLIVASDGRPVDLDAVILVR